MIRITFPLHSKVSALGPGSPVPMHCPSDTPARASKFKVSIHLLKTTKDFRVENPRA